MKLIRKILPVMVIILIISCGGKNEKTPQTLVENATPAALEHNKISINSRTQNNIIDKLFDEAKEKDSKLSQLI